MNSAFARLLSQLAAADAASLQPGFQELLDQILVLGGLGPLPFGFKSEDQMVPTIRQRVATGSTVYVDEAAS